MARMIPLANGHSADEHGRVFDPAGRHVANMDPQSLGNRQAPTPGTVPAQPDIGMTTLADFARSGTSFVHVPLYLPTGLFPAGDNIALVPRDRPLNFAFTTAGGSTTKTLQFEVPTTVFGLTAAAIKTDGTTDLPVGMNPLDTFLVQITRTASGDKLQTEPAPGSTVCGTGVQPRLIGPGGWIVDAGGAFSVNVTNIVANISVAIVLWTCEVRGPSNFYWTQGKFAKT